MSADQPRVLVVEDEPAQREVLAYNLEAEGFAVSRAENGEEALVLVEEVAPDAIVLDWMMPNMSGPELMRRLRKNTVMKDIPIIMLTARGELMDKVVGLELGADDYLTKPFEPRLLLAPQLENTCLCRHTACRKGGAILKTAGVRVPRNSGSGF